MEHSINVYDNQIEYNPYLMKNMSKAVQRVIEAINNREKIVLYGYYDVEGITSVSLLLLLLKYFNADVEYFIPENIIEHREISESVLKDHIQFLGADLIITVGCGINSYNQIEECKKLGIDVIVTDNRKCEQEIPDTYVLNPLQDGCNYPFKQLSSSGIVYKFANVICMEYGVNSAHKYLDLAMLGTISTDMPITNENRTIVERGIQYLCKTNNYGIKALIEENNVYDINEAAAYKLAFTVIPRINAIGRLDNARIAVELFTTKDRDRANQIAKYLIREVDLSKNYYYR